MASNWRTILALPVLATWSCTGRFERPKVPSVIAVPSPNGLPHGAYTPSSYEADLTSYDKIRDTDYPKAVLLRNKMVFSLMAEIDYAFGDYETKLFLSQGSFLIGSDFLQLGLAAGSTITNGARAKTILSALLSGVAGTSLSVDKNFFRQQTLQAITSSMEANRDRIKTLILTQLRQDTLTYPFEAARADLIRYFFAGTLSAGLQQLHQVAAEAAQAREATLSQLQVTNISAADVQSAVSLNQAVNNALKANDLSKLLPWLKAMNAITGDHPTIDKVQSAIRDLGDKILTDEKLRKQYFDEARKVGLIP